MNTKSFFFFLQTILSSSTKPTEEIVERAGMQRGLWFGTGPSQTEFFLIYIKLSVKSTTTQNLNQGKTPQPSEVTSSVSCFRERAHNEGLFTYFKCVLPSANGTSSGEH